MGFLDKVNANKNAAAQPSAPAGKPNPLGGAPKVNPFAKKTETPATPAEKAPAKETVVEKAEEKKVETAAPAKVNPFAKKTAVAPAETVEAAAPEAKKNPFAPGAKTTPVVKAEEIVAETVETAETKVEVTPEVTVTPAETTPKATTKRGANKKAAAKNNVEVKTDAAEMQEDISCVEEVPRSTTATFAEAIAAIKSSFVDEAWDTFRAEVEEKLGAIVISPDMDPSIVRNTLAELSALKDTLWLTYTDTKILYEKLSSKEPEGLIERTKRTNLGRGSNDFERRKAGVEACYKYPSNGEILNLFEILDETRERYTFLEETMGQIKYKSSILITYSGVMKLDKDLMPKS